MQSCRDVKIQMSLSICLSLHPCIFGFFMHDKPFILAGREYKSRLIVGTGKYATLELMRDALEASGSEIVTVAVRRINLQDKSERSFLSFIDRKRFTILPNTAGCYTAEDAIRI